MFPKASSQSFYLKPATLAPAISIDPTLMLMQMQQMQITIMQDRMHHSNQGLYTPQKHHQAVKDDGNMPLSDPPEAGSNQYSSVADFLEKLQLMHPKHNLGCYAVALDVADYYDIDDLKALSEQQLMDRFEMSSGNASFLLREVNNEIKLIDRLTKHYYHNK